jgi:hypothetical protein
MNLIDELQKLEQLRQNGSLTAEEFTKAKTLLLSSSTIPSTDLATIKAFVDKETQAKRLDLDWEAEKQQILKERFKIVRPFYFALIILGLIWGTGLWFVMFDNSDQFSTAMNSSKPSVIVQYVLPILGIATSVLGLLFIIKNVQQLNRNGNLYLAAFKDYQRKRIQILHN